jgi:hypothetical protein
MYIYIEEDFEEDFDLLDKVTTKLRSMGFNMDAIDTILGYVIDLKEIFTIPFNKLKDISEL